MKSQSNASMRSESCKCWICFEWRAKKVAGALSTVEDMKTALITIALKSTGVGFSFWNKCFLKKGNANEIETTSCLSFTLCLKEFIYVEFKNKHIGKGYGQIASKIASSFERQCTKSTKPVGFLLYGTRIVSSKVLMGK